MSSAWQRCLRSACAATAVLTAAHTSANAGADAGIVVLATSPGQVADRAGLRAGDVLLRWQRGDDSGTLRSPFDLTELELEQGPRGPVRLFVRRGDADLAVALFPDEWGLDARPALGAQDAEAHAQARRARDAGDGDAAVAGLRALRTVQDTPRDLQPWLLQEIARVEQRRHRPDAAAAALEEAALLARAAGRATVEAQLLEHLGAVFRDAERLDASAGALDRALAVRERAAPDALATAALAEPLKLAGRRPPDEKRRLLERAIALQERAAPESLALVRTLDTLGWLLGSAEQKKLVARASPLAERHGDSLALARVLFADAWNETGGERPIALFRRALAIQQRLAPESAGAAIMSSFLGRYLEASGEGRQALELEQQAVALVERVAPDTADHGQILGNLGLLWLNRGDLAQAEPLYRSALAIEERREPEGFGVARMLFNLGTLLRGRRELDEAERLFERAFALTEKHGYGRDLGGRCLSNLGEVRRARGDLEGSETVQRQALERFARLSLGQVPNAQARLAETLRARGRYDEAADLYAKSLQAVTAAGYPTLIAERTHALGALALERADLPAAEEWLEAALAVRRRYVSDTMWHAESSHDLGLVRQRRGRPGEALVLLQEAVAALEAQGRRLGGSEEARARFRASYHEYYRDLEDLLLELGRPEEAFAAVERARARGLPTLLASRDIPLGGAIPEELERDRLRADREHDQAFRALQSGSENAEGLARLGLALASARRAQEDVRARIRAAFPRQSALRDPQPLDLAGVRRAVDPGTLVLAYSLGPRAGRLYAVGPGPDEFAVLEIPSGAAAIRDEVRTFREAIETRRGHLQRAQVAAAARPLSAKLLAPAAERLGRAARLVVVPDGALHLLPFAALPDPSASGARRLVESKAVQVVSSITLYDALARKGAERVAPTAVAFGDPAYAQGAPDAAALTRARAGFRLDPLPEARREIRALRTLAANALLFEGADATEERAKALDRDARYVHFACHGFLDERFPLESGLALSVPAEPANGAENGFLQAWEVFESVRLDADLVALSACQTGLGEEMGGEGLLGLTWAFQYAGARSVLASLWEVNDASTATLMTRFYRHLAAGVPKAEALRHAQVDLLRKRTTAAPYFWAGFTLIGDGR